MGINRAQKIVEVVNSWTAEDLTVQEEVHPFRPRPAEHVQRQRPAARQAAASSRHGGLERHGLREEDEEEAHGRPESSQMLRHHRRTENDGTTKSGGGRSTSEGQDDRHRASVIQKGAWRKVGYQSPRPRRVRCSLGAEPHGLATRVVKVPSPGKSDNECQNVVTWPG